MHEFLIILFRLFFKNMNFNASPIKNMGLVKQAYYYFIDRIFPNYDISFVDFALYIL